MVRQGGSEMTEDELWVEDHLSELVEKYAGRYVAVAQQEVAAVGDSLKEVSAAARQRYPNVNPSILRVPREEDFMCAL